jgi:glycolate oxidase FAD binding subunit
VTTPEPPSSLTPEALASLIARSIALVGSDALLVGTRTAHYMVEDHLPSLVALPTSPAQIAALLALAGEVGAAVTPWGGGTQMGIGYPLRRVDMVISLERLNTVITHNPTDHEVTVQAGCTVATLNAALAQQGQFVALDGPLGAHATVGGRLATGTVGLRRGRYGHVRDLITNLVIARSDGVLMHTGGEVARNMLYHTLGYDLNKLYIGSLGTLGVIIQATLRTAPISEAEATVIASFEDVSIIWELLEDLEAAELFPAALTVCGPGTLAADRGLTAERAEQLQPAAHPLLLMRLASDHQTLRRQALTVYSVIMKYSERRPLLLSSVAGLPVWAALNDLPATADLLPTEAVIKVSVLPSELAKVVELAHTIGAEHDLRLAWMGDAATGQVWLRVMGARDAAGAEDRTAFAASLMGLQSALARIWRNATVLGCVPELRAQLPIWGADPEGVQLLRALKGRFDPLDVLNPGRFGGPA